MSLGPNQSTKVRTAVVGVGYLGTFHAQKHKALAEKNPQIDFIGVFDQNQTQAQKVGDSLGCRVFKNLDEMFGQVDAVTIATATPAHFALAERFLSQGVHVNVEKPICLQANQGRVLVDLAKQKQLVFSVGHSERFSPVFNEVKKLGARPSYLEFARRAPFNSRGTEVSVIFDLMIHDLDLMLSLDRSQVRLVAAQAGQLITQTHDWATASFKFASGLVAVVHCSRINPVMERSIRWIDSSGEIKGDFQTGEISVARKQDEAIGIKFDSIQLGKSDNLMLENENFLMTVLNQNTLTVPAADGLRALELAEEIVSLVQTQRGY